MLKMVFLTNLLVVRLFVLLSPMYAYIQLDELLAYLVDLENGRDRTRGPKRESDKPER